mgnify:CR=1 FL=1
MSIGLLVIYEWKVIVKQGHSRAGRNTTALISLNGGSCIVIILNISIFVLCIAGLFILQKKKFSFNVLVLTALVGAIVFGIFLNQFGREAAVESMRWINIIGNIYVRLLKMMVIPLIFVSIVCAIINQKSGKQLGKMAALALAFLLGTAAIAATVGGLTAMTFHLTADGIAIGETEQYTTHSLEDKAGSMELLEDSIVAVIPANPFYAMTGQGPNATLSVVLIACLLGVGVIGMRTYEPEQADLFTKWMNALNTLVVEIVMMVIMLTPYGIFSLMTSTVAGGDFASILRLAKFVIASYSAIFIMFIIHGIILMVLRLNPLIYYKKALTALTFAFTSRTSAGTLPLTIRTLTEKMGISGGVANLAASLGVSIGQNGCAAIYPAMLVVMVAPTVGRPVTPGFFLLMVLTITVVSIGIAGVGGGATFAGIMVLSALGLPVGIAGLLIAIEPLIDMARTALNVSDGMVSALGTAKLTRDLNQTTYDDPKIEFIDKATNH